MKAISKISNYHILKGEKRGSAEVRLLFLSDLHEQISIKQTEGLIRKICRYKPDFICVGGDMVLAKKSLNPHASMLFLKKIAQIYPVYYANGNHELAWKRKKPRIYRTYKKELEKCGVCFLENESRLLEIKDKKILLYGLEMDRIYFKRGKMQNPPKGYIEGILGKADTSFDYSILLAHSPRYFEAYTDWGADLTLAGHYHGGILRRGQTGFLSPYLQFFPPYCCGLYERKGKKMIVSAGMGDHYPNPRWGNKKEMVGITLYL